MAQYRKKPVIVNAMQWDGNPNLWEDVQKNAFLIDCYESGYMVITNNELLIHTPYGTKIAIKGDYIIRGIKGEFYPCKEEIFNAVHERVEV